MLRTEILLKKFNEMFTMILEDGGAEFFNEKKLKFELEVGRQRDV